MSKIIKINKLFEKQAELYPNKIAIIHEDKKITYAELNGMANQLAHVMVNQGIKPGDLVPLFIEKNIETFIAILAILKTGAAFYLFNPEQLEKSPYPILEFIQAKHIVSQSNLLNHFKDYSRPIINLTSLAHVLSGVSEKLMPVIEANDNDIAYGILTSGTTGNPKYVVITHKNLLDTYYSWESVYNLSQTDVHLQMAAIGFDVFVGDWVRALCSGAQLVLCSKETLLQPKELYNLIMKYQISCAEFVPATLRGLINYLEYSSLNLETFRLLLCGSDQWSMDEYRRVKLLCSPKTRVINSYGLSETTIDSTYFEEDTVILPSTSIVPAGKPFPHVKIYLLDEHGQLVPNGEEGEIYIGGTGVGSYLNQPRVSIERFFPDPYISTQKIYKTGDKGRLLSDGNLEFLGRNQLHIKYDGKRIELSIIESLLNQHQGINQALVIPEITQPGKALLNCFIDLSDQAINYNELRRYLNDALSNFTVPTKFYVVKKIALTMNGKLDRKISSQTILNELTPEIIQPNTPLETELVKIWQEILKIEEIGLLNNFYDLGGSSLLFIQMIEEVNERLQISLPPSLSIKTIKALSKAINALNQELPLEETNRIAIIGGGPAAVSLCWQLFNEIKFSALHKTLEIIVFEKNKDIGLGLPYAQKEASYILNLPKDNMEPIPDKNGEFSDWLKSNYPIYADKSEFPPRFIFGKYLKYLAKKLQKEARKSNIKVSYRTSTTVLNISKFGLNSLLIQSTEGELKADYVVLCTGHMPSDTYQKYIGKPGYWHSPWNSDAFLKIEHNDSVGIIGTRLTAIDIAMKLLDQTHNGPITMISHSGLLPTVLAKKIPPYKLQYFKLESFSDSIKLSQVLELFFNELSLALNKPCSFESIIKSHEDIKPLAWINKEIEQAEKDVKPWQQVMFSLYPMVPDIWQRMDLRDQKKFMLQYNSLFMTYLAGFPLENAYKIKNLLESGQLKVLGGLQSIKQQDGKFILQGEKEVAKTKYLFNATGPSYNVRHQPLYTKMLDQKLILQHPLGGIDIKLETLQVLNSNKQLNPRLFAIGELTRGKFLTTTDLASVARQGTRIARALSSKISQPTVCNTIKRNIHSFRFFSRYSLPTQCFSNFQLIHKYLSKG